MLKSRWRYRPGRQFPAEQQPEKPAPEQGSLLSGFKEVAVFLSGTAGLFLAILWLAGRNYANGFFAAMNVPAFIVTASIWEYAEVAWLPALVCAAIVAALVFFNQLYFRFLSWIAYRLLRARVMNYVKILWLLSILTAFYGLDQLLQFMTRFGYENGEALIQNGTTQIEVVTDTLQPLGTPVVVSPSEDDQRPAAYVYQGLRLISYNNGRYYLFRELDPTTCKPKQVHVVDEDQCLQVNIVTAPPLGSGCQGARGQAPVSAPNPGATTQP